MKLQSNQHCCRLLLAAFRLHLSDMWSFIFQWNTIHSLSLLCNHTIMALSMFLRLSSPSFRLIDEFRIELNWIEFQVNIKTIVIIQRQSSFWTGAAVLWSGQKSIISASNCTNVTRWVWVYFIKCNM